MPMTSAADGRGLVLGSALLAGCTQGSSQIETAAMLPRPQVVVVQDFAVAPGEVQLDPGLSGTIDETLGANAAAAADRQGAAGRPPGRRRAGRKAGDRDPRPRAAGRSGAWACRRASPPGW